MDPDGNEAVFYSWNKEHDNYRPPVSLSTSTQSCFSTIFTIRLDCFQESKKCTKMSDGGTIAKCDVTQEDGNIICHFFMKTKIEIERHTFDLTNKPYYIFQAIGSDLREIETKTSMLEQFVLKLTSFRSIHRNQLFVSSSKFKKETEHICSKPRKEKSQKEKKEAEASRLLTSTKLWHRFFPCHRKAFGNSYKPKTSADQQERSGILEPLSIQ